MATFGVHFDGKITVEHKVSIRVLARTYEHMQRAIDRAYLIEVHGQVWKHARLKAAEYQETDFIAEYPREGGIILDAIREGAGPLVDRIAGAIRPVFARAAEGGLEEFESFDAQLGNRKAYVAAMQLNTPKFEDVADDPPVNWAPAYSNRSITKEIDQLVSQVTPKDLEGSTVDLTFHGDTLHLPFEFDAVRAKNFHTIASQRELAAPMLVKVNIRGLDKGNKFTRPKAKIMNLHTKREVTLHLSGPADFEVLHPHHDKAEVLIYVCPVVEALGFDIHGGDLMFLAVAA